MCGRYICALRQGGHLIANHAGMDGAQGLGQRYIYLQSQWQGGHLIANHAGMDGAQGLGQRYIYLQSQWQGGHLIADNLVVQRFQIVSRQIFVVVDALVVA